MGSSPSTCLSDQVKWLRFPRVLGVALCLYLLAMAVLFGYLSTLSYRFVSNATATQGTVIGLEVKRPAGSQHAPDLRRHNLPMAPQVRYEVAGHRYTYVAAHGRFHQRVRVGDHVTVLYDPSYPAHARLRGEGRIMLPLITSGFATGSVVLAIVLYLTRVPHRSRRTSSAAAPCANQEPEPDDTARSGAVVRSG